MEKYYVHVHVKNKCKIFVLSTLQRQHVIKDYAFIEVKCVS